MRSLFVLVSAWLLTVPFLGLLSSCSKKSDDWSMREPAIVGTGRAPTKLGSVISDVLPADAGIDFSGSEFASLKITSNCTFETSSFSDKHVIPYQKRVSLKSLWPSEMWLKFNNNQLVQSRCDFSFETTNSKGSTQDFEMASVQLQSFATQRARNANAATVRSSGADVLKIWSTLLKAPHSLKATCGNRDFQLAANSASEAAVGSAFSNSGLYGEQTCVFKAYSELTETSLPEYEISPEAKILFDRVPLEITHQTLSDSGVDGRHNFYKIEFRNPTDEATFIRLPSGPQPVNMHAILFDPKLSFRGSREMPNSTLQPTASGGTLVSNGSGAELWRIEAHSILTVLFSTDALGGQDITALELIHDAPVNRFMEIKGFEYGFIGKFSVVQFSTADAQDPAEIFAIEASQDQPYKFGN